MSPSGSAAHVQAGAGLVGPRLAAALQDAMRRCELNSARLTAGRRRVLELLLLEGRPVKAYDLVASFYREDRGAPPTTVYRALEFLERQGLVHRVASLNAYAACRYSDTPHVAVFLICDCCRSVREAAPLRAIEIMQGDDAHCFQVRRIAIEARGLCANCIS